MIALHTLPTNARQQPPGLACPEHRQRDCPEARTHFNGEVDGGTALRRSTPGSDARWWGIVAEQKSGYNLDAPGSAAVATSATTALPGAPAATPAPATTPVPGTPSPTLVPAVSVTSFEAAVATMVSHLTRHDELTRLDVDTIRARLALLRRLQGATTASVAATVAALDQVGGVAADGAASTAEWLKTNAGHSGRQAAQVARLARDLHDLPGTSEALSEGRLTAESADALVQAARDGRLGGPGQVESDLLTVATTGGPEQLRRSIQRRQQRADGAAMLRDEQRQQALRRLSFTQRIEGGMWELHGALPHELGTKLRTVLNAHDHPDPAGTPLRQQRRPDQRLADALQHMTEAVLDHGLAPGSGGITRPHLSVIVDVATVSADLRRHDAPDPDASDAALTPDHPAWAGLPPGDTAWGGQLSPQAVRRLLCDAAVSRIVMSGSSQVLDVGRTTRRWSGPQRRAVNARDRGCRGPNCTRPIAWTHIHHLQWWRHDGPTSVDNGVALCHHCHHLVHDRNWTANLDASTSVVTWTSPDGQMTTTQPHAPQSQHVRPVLEDATGRAIPHHARPAPGQASQPAAQQTTQHPVDNTGRQAHIVRQHRR